MTTQEKSWKENGSLKFLQQIAVLSVLMATIIGGVVYVTARLARLESEVHHLNKQIVAINKFMMAGERFTAEDGKHLRNKIDRLEAEIRGYPPQWFRNNFSDLRLEVKDLRVSIVALNNSVATLKIRAEKQDNLEHKYEPK